MKMLASVALIMGGYILMSTLSVMVNTVGVLGVSLNYVAIIACALAIRVIRRPE